MHGFSILILVCDLPKRRLFAITRPVTLAGLLHGIEARLVLPVIITSAQHQAILGPDDLRSDIEAGGLKAVGNRGSMQRTVPDISHIAPE